MEIKQQDILSLSPMQEAILFHSLFDKGNSYFKQLLIQAEGDFKPELFEKSLNLLIDRYEIFRTAFLYKKVKKPRQVILKERKIKILYEDISHLPDEEKEQQIRARIKQDQDQPFDLLKDVLLRVTVLKTGTRRFQIIFSSHHILLDGWCMGIIFDDLFQIYGKLRRNEPVPAGKVPQYREFIHWLEKQNQSVAKAYWKQLLSGYEEPVQVPGKERVADGEYKLGELELKLGENLTRKLNKMARSHHLTLNNVIQTIWGLLLQRYNNTEDVVFGSVVSGRNKPIRDIQKMVGLFINTIPVRVKGSGEERFVDLAKRVQQSALASEPYDYVSLADIQESMQFGGQLFDHIVVFENYAFDPNVFDKYTEQLGFKIEAKSTFDKTNYDFNVIVQPGEELAILFQYNELAYSRTRVERLFGHFRHIAEQVTQQPEKLLKEIELVTEPEKKQLLHQFNQTDADYPREKTIQEIFEEQADKYPEQIAVKIREKALTYKELNEQANQLAHVLRKEGIGRGQIVGLMTERSLEMMIGMLAIVKAGGAYMPIDPEYPQDRKQFMLQDSEASVLLLQPGLEIPASYQGKIVRLSPEVWKSEDRSNLNGINRADDLLYVIYTSGSTGKPKGNRTIHRNVLRTVINSGYIEISKNDRLLQLSNYCFDGSTFDIYGALLNGAALVMVPKEVVTDFTRLSQLIRDEQITVTFMTTSLFNTIVDLDPYCLRNLRKVLFGGEKASIKHVQKAVRVLGENRLVNVYGPTETTVFATTFPIDNSVLDTHRVPIGKPLNNTRLYVLNRWGQLQPVGIPGELCISGDGVAKGYLNRPELTRERFVEDPFQPGKCMYKTGDLVRWLPDGNIEYLERMDDQVKIRGHRIETGEVELRLLSHPKVLNTVVVADKDENGHSYLSAYVVAERDISHTELREYMSETLPDYMVPDYFVQMAQLPLTPNGKVDKRALPKPSEAGRNKKRKYVAATNPIEEKLVKIWQGVLDVEQIGIHDDFFESGGHSLKAMVLSSQVNKQFHVDFPLREIFARPTVQKQADYIRKCQQKEFTEISPAPTMEYYPVSSAQKRLYMVGQLEGLGTGYNMPYVFRIRGSVPVRKLEGALQSLVVRHEALRTSFHLVKGELKQKIHPEVSITIESYQAEDEHQCKQIIRQFIRPFDLEQAPLMRIGLLDRTDSEEQFLLMDFHHIVVDGVSIQIMFQELISLMKGEELPLPALQYKDYAVWQQNARQKEEWTRHEEYWLNKLSGELPVLDLPTDYPRPGVQRFEGDHLTFQFDPTLSRKLKQFCDEQKVTLYMVLMAAYNLLLSKYSGQQDLIVGSPVAGRPHADLQSIVGMFANTMAVRSQVDPELTFARFVRQMKENILEMTEHQDYPFEELVEKLNVKRDLSRNPLFDTMFSMQNNVRSSFDFPGFSIKLAEEEWEWKKAKFDMSWILGEGETIHGIVEYATHLFKTETIQKMIRDYMYLVGQVVENPNLSLGEIELVTPEEKQKLLQTFNDTRLEYPRGKAIQTWFEEQAAARPEQAAVVCGQEQLSYRELNERANRLAHALRKKGIGKEQIVGILMPASIDMLTAILGVLKAGAAYL
ncbi:MAG: amino acid adenylation domain-containing protein, partial [Thermoactinomyces sp.]